MIVIDASAVLELLLRTERGEQYDAAYVALTEALDASLLTCDMKLARSHAHRARIEVVK